MDKTSRLMFFDAMQAEVNQMLVQEQCRDVLLILHLAELEYTRTNITRAMALVETRKGARFDGVRQGIIDSALKMAAVVETLAEDCRTTASTSH